MRQRGQVRGGIELVVEEDAPSVGPTFFRILTGPTRRRAISPTASSSEKPDQPDQPDQFDPPLMSNVRHFGDGGYQHVELKNVTL